jgi:hypothetical protein
LSPRLKGAQRYDRIAGYFSSSLLELVGEELVVCPKTLLWQWQAEMRDLLAMPSAVWDGRCWVDEQGYKHQAIGPEGVLKCPRRVGIVSSGLISHGSEAARPWPSAKKNARRKSLTRCRKCTLLNSVTPKWKK